MIRFLLGVADQASNSQGITNEDFLEFKNSMYDYMKDTQDIARNVQSDQITFLQNNLTNFLAVTAIVIGLLSLVVGLAFNKIKKDSDAAKKLMDNAEDMMKTAQKQMNDATDLMEAAQNQMDDASIMIQDLENQTKESDKKLIHLNQAQVNLKALLDSKDLDEKLSSLEKSASLTKALELQVQSTLNLQLAKQLNEDADDLARELKSFFFEEELRQKVFNYRAECSKLRFFISSSLVEIAHTHKHIDNFNYKQVNLETNGLLQKAAMLNKEINQFYNIHVLKSEVEKEKENEKED